MKPFNALEHPIVFLRPKLSPPYSWAGHIPFAYLATSLIRPRKLVELGTHSGNSYLAFCQAVLAAEVEAECFAVDTWEGDGHATQYGSGVYAALNSYHAPRYAGFSRLLKKTFDDALADFDHQEIDLLHIDGLHTYEAVKHDFETWLPKLSERAVVLMHDISVTDRDFGVWRYFEELGKRYRTFSFEHSNGLGVVCVGDEVPEAFTAFLDAADAAPDTMRRFFEGVASTVVDTGTGLARSSDASGQARSPITAKLFYRSSDDVFSESNCSVASVDDLDGRLRLVFNLPAQADLSFLRMDPADFPGVYGICSIRLVAAAGEALEVTDFPSRALRIAGEVLPPKPPAFIRFVSLGSDPSVEFDLSGLIQETSEFNPERIEVDVIYGPVLSDEVSAHLANVVDEATLEARAKARTLDHVVNLLGEHANVTLGLADSVGGLERAAGLSSTAIKNAIDEVAAVSSSVNERQARMELEAVLAGDALQEQVEGLRAYVDRLGVALHEVGESVLARVETISQAGERTALAVESQMATLARMVEEQERATAFLKAVHMRLDRRSPFYWIRRLLGGQR